jgi:NitT/TauT family transport system substrate-binding protein
MLARPFKLALPVLVAALSIAFAPQVHAQDKVLKVGTLKLIHGISAYFYEKFVPAGYTVEVIPFESPTDGKNAVLTGTVDTCIHGIARSCSAPRRASRC